eukprot:1530343-Rhodomonas_salina.1
MKSSHIFHHLSTLPMFASNCTPRHQYPCPEMYRTVPLPQTVPHRTTPSVPLPLNVPQNRLA